MKTILAMIEVRRFTKTVAEQRLDSKSHSRERRRRTRRSQPVTGAQPIRLMPRPERGGISLEFRADGMGRNTSEAQEVNTEKGYHLLRRANAIARRALSFRFFRIHCRRSIFQASLDLYDRNWHFVLQYPWCLNRANNHLLQSRHCRMRSK